MLRGSLWICITFTHTVCPSRQAEAICPPVTDWIYLKGLHSANSSVWSLLSWLCLKFDQVCSFLATVPMALLLNGNQGEWELGRSWDGKSLECSCMLILFYQNSAPAALPGSCWTEIEFSAMQASLFSNLERWSLGSSWYGDEQSRNSQCQHAWPSGSRKKKSQDNDFLQWRKPLKKTNNIGRLPTLPAWSILV